jgi:hypothetical protein
LPDVEELSDEEVAALEVDGLVLEHLHPRTWWQLAMTRTGGGVVQAVAYLEQWERRLSAEKPGPRRPVERLETTPMDGDTAR